MQRRRCEVEPTKALHPSFYVTGGTLPSDSPSYVERQADRDIYEGLRRGEFSYVLTSRQMGKSSLMIRTAARLRSDGIAVAVLDLTAVGQNLTSEQWYEGLLNQVGQQLHLEDQLDDYWSSYERVGPLQRFMRALRDEVLPSLGEQPLVLFIDEIDAVRSLPFNLDEFFAAIRECHNRRARDSRSARLTFCLLGVTTPGELIRDTRTTPFNIGRRIDLQDFTPAEGLNLARGLPVDKRTRTALIQRILYWTGGHPYLTQRLCHAAAEERVRSEGGIDSLCHRLFLSAEARECDDNLQFVRDRLLRNDGDIAVLLDLYAHILRGERVAPDDTNPVLDVLRLSGVVRLDRGRLVVRNRVYGRVFDGEWVVRHMPDAELRRQRSAYRRGIVRAAALSSVVVAALAGLAGVALSEAANARLAEAKAREMLYVTQVAQAHTASDLGMEGRAREILDAQDKDLRHWEWHYLRKCSDATAEQEFPDRPGQPICAVAFVRNNLLAIPTWNAVRLFSVPDGKCVNTLKNVLGEREGERNPEALAVSPDGALVAIAGQMKAVIWHIPSGKQISAIPHSPEARFLQFSPDGRYLAAAFTRRGSLIWDVRWGHAIRGDLPEATCLTYSPDGKRLLLSGRRGVLHVLETSQWRDVDRITTEGEDDWRLCITRDGRTLATTAPSGKVGLWKLGNGTAGGWRLVGELNAHTVAVRGVSFSPNGETLATAGHDGTVRLWDVASRTLLDSLDAHSQGEHVTFSPSGKWLASCGPGLAKLWTSQQWSRNETQSLTPLSAAARDSVSPDGRLLILKGPSGTLRLARLPGGKELVVPPLGAPKLHPARVQPFTADSRALYAFGTSSASELNRRARANTRKLYRWDLDTNRVETLAAQEPPGTELQAVSADGRFLICAGPRTISIVSAQTGKPMRMLPNPTVWMLSPLGHYLLTHDSEAERDQLWSLDADAPVNLTVRTGAIGFSPDDEMLIYAPMSDAVLRDIRTGRVRHRLPGHSGPVTAWCFSPDHSLFATGSEDKNVRIWDLRTGQNTALLQGHTGTVEGIAFSPDGARLATFGKEGRVRVWSTRLGRELLSLNVSSRGELRGFDREGVSLLFEEKTAGQSRLRIWNGAPHTPHQYSARRKPTKREPHTPELLREVVARQVDHKSVHNLVPYTRSGIRFSTYYRNQDPGLRATWSQANGVTTAIVSGTGQLPWAANLDIQQQFKLQEGKRYALQFRAKSDRDRPITVKVQREPNPQFEIGLEEEVDLTAQWQAFRFTFTARDPEGKAGLAIFTGQALGEVSVADLLLAEAPEEQ